jgi:hypothetical protein
MTIIFYVSFSEDTSSGEDFMDARGAVKPRTSLDVIERSSVKSKDDDIPELSIDDVGEDDVRDISSV